MIPAAFRLWTGLVLLVATACGTRVEETAPAQSAMAEAAPVATSTAFPGSSPGEAPTGPAGTRRVANGSTAMRSTAHPGGDTSERPPDLRRPVATMAPGQSAATAAAAATSRAAPARTLAPAGAPRPELTIGNVGTYSGPLGEPWSRQRDAVRVWVAMVNARGGLSGAPVRLVSADDGGDPARHLALARELVENRGVIAFVGNAEAITGAASVDYVNRVKVPVIGSEGGGEYFYGSPNYFPQQPHGQQWVTVALAAGAVQGAARGKHRFGTIVCVEVSVCDQADKLAPTVVRDNGMEVVSQQRASLTQPDFTAECLSARNARVEVLLAGLDPNSVVRLAESCARQGYRPIYALNGGVASSVLLSSKPLDGAAVSAAVFPYVRTDTAAVNEFHQAMVTFAPRTVEDMNHMVGWVAAKLFERSAGDVPAGPTAADVLAGLGQISGDDLGGLTYPLTFHPGTPAPRVTCWWNMTIAQGAYAVFGDGRRVCR